ncbi:Nitroreductase [Algoriella xinjiangensis]|uniref:Nitroreductase n=1 Tax=Algoriella xinjiangensis TaxID=684065 RepID=A0A1I4Y003_9FLAO|nr:NAD(P)H-dependent oxidoreductase [Algoriella xinjiangensis]SFN31392.1 Nitroreductase [Algoriella xinjiangensis]VDH15363.1 Major NAD(P)H-flavin oxidoreductase [Algoriella xinjiangensis]
MSFIDDLKWRYATKKYDPSKKVSQENVEKIVEAARLAPTSSGLQQFRVIVIKNQDLKNKILPIAYNQQAITDCSHLLIFAAWDNYTEERIDEVYTQITKERELEAGFLTNYTDTLKKMFLNNTEEENFIHASYQTYIAFGFSIAQAAELKVDCTPMEGFKPKELDKLLDLEKYGLKSILLLPIGYRDEENDWNAKMKKVRNPKEKFMIEIN